MGEEAEREAGRFQSRDATAVAQQPRSVSSVSIADRTQILIVATDECRTTSHPADKLQNGPIDLMAKLNHRFGFIKVFARKELGRSSSKSALRGDEDLTGVLSAAC